MSDEFRMGSRMCPHCGRNLPSAERCDCPGEPAAATKAIDNLVAKTDPLKPSVTQADEDAARMIASWCDVGTRERTNVYNSAKEILARHREAHTRPPASDSTQAIIDWLREQADADDFGCGPGVSEVLSWAAWRIERGDVSPINAASDSTGGALREALAGLLARDIRNTCTHENSHRGGAIWEICDDCEAKWADDEGGKPVWVDPPEWVAARAALSQPSPDEGAGHEP